MEIVDFIVDNAILHPPRVRLPQHNCGAAGVSSHCEGERPRLGVWGPAGGTGKEVGPVLAALGLSEQGDHGLQVGFRSVLNAEVEPAVFGR